MNCRLGRSTYSGVRRDVGRSPFRLAVTVCALALFGGVRQASAQSLVQFIYTFSTAAESTDGQIPIAALVQGTNGNFYGTTLNGGSAGNGTVFEITPSGAETVLHSFGDGSVANDGMSPCAALVLGPDGNYYGTTAAGGIAGHGTVFKMTPAGGVTILHSFGDGTVSGDGDWPRAALVYGGDGYFYGETYYGGSTATTNFGGYGCVFKISTAGSVTILHSFNDGSVINDGECPESTLLLSPADGNLYGTTFIGGSASIGTIFRITTEGSETVLHSFADGTVPNDGMGPECGVILHSDGNYYGTTLGGGEYSHGAVYRMSPAGTVTIVHSFNENDSNDGSGPGAALLAGSDGNLYGTTAYGGWNGEGTLFQMTTGGAITLLASGAASGFNDICAPMIQASDHNLYGTAGGAQNGLIYKVLFITPSTPADLTGHYSPDVAGILNWQAGAYATSYNVYRGTTPGGEGTKPYEMDANPDASIPGSAPTVPYYYKVAAVNPFGTSGLSNEAEILPAPVPPSALTATAGDTSAVLNWMAAAYAATFDVYVDTSATGAFDTVLKKGLAATSFTSTGLTNGTTYYYKVASVNASAQSALSASASATPMAATAKFVKIDTTTMGSWKGVYGSDGYDIIGDPSSDNPKIPSSVKLTSSHKSSAVWTPSSTSAWALQTAAPDSTDHLLGVWYSPTSFTINVDVTGSSPLALYLYDWRAAGRAESISVTDTATGAQLDERTATDFGGGVYYVWNVSGNVTVTITRVFGPSCVVSGVFFK